MRPDNRKPDELRHIELKTNPILYPEGSALIIFGNTKVLCTASVEEKVPPFRKGTGQGWVTAEYAMLPRSTHTRKERDRKSGRIDGRSQEIQRLIGRSLRAIVDLEALGERSITVDCDVIQADGGTRTAAVTGGCVALAIACNKLQDAGLIKKSPIIQLVAAVSVGLVNGEILADLCYLEDSSADTDLNFVGTEDGGVVEVQGTAEHDPFTIGDLNSLVTLARSSLDSLFALQREALGAIPVAANA